MSENIKNIKKNENKKNFQIDVSKDKMQCFIIFKNLEEEELKLDLVKIKKILKDEKIVYGIKDNLIKVMLKDLKCNKKYIVAEGKLPTKGKDGYLEFKFDISAKNLKPKELPNGKVDYRNLNIIKEAKKDDVLVNLISPTKGEEGINVFGETVEGILGKKAEKIPKGKNTIISEDKTKLISCTNGQIVYTKNKINIEEVLEIKENVGVSTGNINFNGSVIVRGSIITDFSVKATGNVEVHGIVEGGEIYSGGNIFCNKGILGMFKSNIHAEGNITSKTIQDANIFCKGDIIADGIMHSNVKCEGMIELKGKKGLFVGGKTYVQNGLKANIIGSPMGTVTEIYLGYDTFFIEENNNNLVELHKLKEEYQRYLKSLQCILKLKPNLSIPKDKKISFLNTVNLTKDMKKRIEELEEKTENFSKNINEDEISNLVIEINKILYPGVTIKIGGAIKIFTDETYKCKIRNIDNKIKIC